MMGAIIGDIVGSVYEWNNIRHKDFPFFSPKCDFTDDSVMTIAVAQALMDGGRPADYAAAMRRLGRRFPNRGYGGRFGEWLYEENPAPYNSWGNGSAMRVSPVAWAFDSLEEVEQAARVSAEVTHNHPEGVRGAQATAAAIFLARSGADKGDIRRHVEERYGYDLSRTLDQIRPTYRFNESCQQTVPEAITAFLESDGFEDAIRCAISLGGDSDTLAAITGGIAEAAYGIPGEILAHARQILDPELLAICDAFDAFADGRRRFPNAGQAFESKNHAGERG